MKQRDEAGRSASFFANQLLDLATSCVGETAMLQFLMQSRKARLKVLGLFDDLVSLEEDGKLRLKAGVNSIAADVGPIQTDLQQSSSRQPEHASGRSNFHCEWNDCARCFNTVEDLDVSLVDPF